MTCVSMNGAADRRRRSVLRARARMHLACRAPLQPLSHALTPQNFVTYTMPKMTIPKLRMLAEEIMRISGMNLMLRSQERKADLVDR